MQFNYQKTREPLCLPPFLRSCSWKLLVQPDDNFSIFSRKSGGKDLSSSIFFFSHGSNVRNLTDSLLKGTLALTVSEWKEASSSVSHGCLSTGSLGLRNSVDTRCKDFYMLHTPLPPTPSHTSHTGELLVLWALWWLLSVILRQENKHKRFKGEMDYYPIVYAFQWCVRRLVFISLQCGMEKKYKVLLIV